MTTTPEKPEKITVGKVITRKKPLGRRFAETFFGGDARSVADYVIRDVILPAVKETIVDAASQGFERMIFGESRGPRPTRGRFGATPYTPYHTYGSQPTKQTNYQAATAARPISRQARSQHNFDEIILASRAEAENILFELGKRIEKYEQCTVGDLYDMVGVEGDFTNEKWGWTDLSAASVSRIRTDQYLLNLPTPIELD